MPAPNTATLYIRKSIRERFMAEKNKSGLVGKLLEEHYKKVPVKNPKQVDLEEVIASVAAGDGTQKPITFDHLKAAADRMKAEKVPHPAPPNFPGVAEKRILKEKSQPPSGHLVLEQPCCSAVSPCKHWSYDGMDMVWTNSLSGRKKRAE